MTSVALHTDRAPRERPIPFSAPMIRAILDGRKTQTRRIVRIDDTPITEHSARPDWKNDRPIGGQRGIPSDAQNVRYIGTYLKCDAPPGSVTVSSRVWPPYGHPGDRLWVRETFALRTDVDPATQREKARAYVKYRADADNLESEWHDYERWRPSTQMPRWASRITLEVTSVRVERLQSISESDAQDEGVDGERAYTGHGNYEETTPREAFAKLWDSINAARAPWSSNPWVWVVSFQRKSP